mmetsp:Transcript_118560/g.221522  ORF Transcript_118560/g.221522 Transcript_118560/m.221522 type:complete len:762 (-) Transcript_118560:187-2472(-)
MGGAAGKNKGPTVVTITEVKKVPAAANKYIVPPEAQPKPLLSATESATRDRAGDHEVSAPSSPQSTAAPTGPPSLQGSWREVYDHMMEIHKAQDADADVDALNEARKAEIRPSADVSQPCSADGIYARLSIVEPEGHKVGQELSNAAQRILNCIEIRKKYIADEAEHVEPETISYIPKDMRKMSLASMLGGFDGDCALSQRESGKKIQWDIYKAKPPALDSSLSITFEDGIFKGRDAAGTVIGQYTSVEEFCHDYVYVLQTMNDRSCASLCNPRLSELDLKFDLYTHRNANREAESQKHGGRDWYQIRKVDTHIHHSACFSQRRLMHFIRVKMRDEPGTVVMKEGEQEKTLMEILGGAGLDEVKVASVDALCCMASMGNGQSDTFGRFDRFNSKYNPFGNKVLRDIFLKSDNYMEGRFLGELTKEVMHDIAAQKFVNVEWRISIYGRQKEEWQKLAKWFRTNELHCPQVRWLIQVPRLYPLFKKIGAITNFADMLANIFEPLFEATVDPETHEDLFYLLQQVVGFDSVDDESQGTHMTLKEYPKPQDWVSNSNPPYTYWMYYMHANIRSLNALRKSRGLSTFRFRPHCGEAGNVSHLCSGFMLADSICHGVQLMHSPVLQYLYYVCQVGLAVSPLSNDILFVPLQESPFGAFFKRGLNVSLSTDDPLIIHLTEDALIEEYVVAARTFRLSMTDMCEIARNSVLQSGFEKAFKHWWVGGMEEFESEAQKQEKSNVPAMRLQFRADNLQSEMDMLRKAASECN